jgi:hypothetical protein
MNYLFNTEHISQHIVKYGVDIRPPIVPDQEKTKLQDYCNWLIEQFPEAFETLLLGPKQLQIQKPFVLAGGRHAQFPTLILTNRGPLFAFPIRLYIGQAHDIDIIDKDKIFRKALDELRTRFAEKTVPRIGVVNEFVFDTGRFNSLDIVASNLRNNVWKEKIKNLRIILEAPTEGKNINIELRPTFLQRTSGTGDLPDENMKFGIIVNLDINNQQTSDNLPKSDVNDILTFVNDFVQDELIRFLNNEY